MDQNPTQESGLIERVISINRVAKVVKGGRRFHFAAIVVLGDGQGAVGIGKGKAHEVPEAIRKANDDARKNMRQVPLDGTTIPHEVEGHAGSGHVLLKPAFKGTGVIAGGAIRAIMEAAGVKDVLTKCLGSNNPHNVVNATLRALGDLESKEEAYRRRQKTMPQQA